MNQADSDDPTTETASDGARRKATAWAGVFLLALLIRLIYLWESADAPTFWVPIVDSAQYDRLARGFAEGRGIGSGFFWQPFFYPAFLSVIYSVSGSSIVAAKVVQAIVGSATCGMSYLLGRRVFSHWAGVGAGIITACYGPLIFFEGELVGAGWAAFWAVTITLVLIHVQGRPTVRGFLVLGLCGALGVITRPPLLPFFAVGSLWVVIDLVRRQRWGNQAGWSVVAGLLGFALIAVPVSAIQHRVMGRFSFIPSSGGINFYVGNNADLCQTLRIRPGPDWEWLTQMPARHGAPGQWASSPFFYGEVWDYLWELPGDFMKGLGYKASQFWNSRELPRNVDVYLFREWSQVLRFLVWKVGGFGFPFGALLPLALIGVVMNWRRVPAAIWLILALYCAAIVAVFVTARYRVVIVPVMAVLAAQGVYELVALIRRGRTGRVLLVSGLGIVVAMLSSVPSAYCVEDGSFAAEMHNHLGSELSARGRMREAVAALAEALRLDPEHAGARYNLGVLLRKQGKIDEAADQFEMALKRKPHYRKARKALGGVLLQRGDVEHAKAVYTEGIRVDATDADSHQGLGAISAGEGNFAEAVKHYTEALRFDQRSAKTYTRLVQALTDLGRIEEGIARLREGITYHPQNADLYDQLGELYATQGQVVQAVEAYRESLSLHSNRWTVANKLAWILATSEDASVRDGEEAIRLASAACEATRYGDARTLDTLGAAYAETGRFEEAIRTARRAANRASGNTLLAGKIRKRIGLYSNGKPFRRTDK